MITLLFLPYGKNLFAQQEYSKLELRLIKTIQEDSQLETTFVPNILVYYQADGTEGMIHLSTNNNFNQDIQRNLPIPLGDVSQAWTAHQILNLVEEGNLSIAADVSLFLPQGYRQDTTITIKSLLVHQAGLSKIPNNFGRYETDSQHPYQFYTDTALLQYFTHQDLKSKLGKYQYSLTGYAILQYLLTQKGVTMPSFPKSFNQGYKDGKPIKPINYYNFSGAKGIALSPDSLYQLIKKIKATSAAYPFYPTGIQKQTNSSYGFHVLQRKKKEIAILKSASDGFTLMAAFDRQADRILLIIANAQDHTGGLYGAVSWFFK